MLLSKTALSFAPLAAVMLLSAVRADGNDLDLESDSTRFVKRRASPSWDEPYVPETSGLPNSQSVPACYGLNRPLKPYDEGGRGLELLETMKPVKCKDDGECRNVFLNEDVKERGVTETTCKKEGNNEFGVCEVKCREGWKEYEAVKGHCSVSLEGMAFYDYCCGGSIASAEGCMCPAGKGLVSSGTCEA